MRIRGFFAAAAVAASAAAAPPPDLESFTQPALRDVSARLRIVSKNERELRKIGKGFVDAYSLRSQEIWFQEPGRVRFEGKKGLFTIRQITNGDRKLFEVSPLGVRKVENIARKPAKGEDVTSLGVLTPGFVKSVESRWLRTEQRNGRTLQVFDIWYPADAEYRHTLWIDPETRTLVEKVSHHRDRRKTGFRKRLVFSDPQAFGPVRIPASATLYNGENRVAAVMRYESIRVNSGIREALFRF